MKWSDLKPGDMYYNVNDPSFGFLVISSPKPESKLDYALNTLSWFTLRKGKLIKDSVFTRLNEDVSDHWRFIVGNT